MDTVIPGAACGAVLCPEAAGSEAGGAGRLRMFGPLPIAVPEELPAVMPDQDLGLPSLGGLRRRAQRWLARRALQASA